MPWPDVHVWWGDDRFVPRDHALSNVKPFDDILLDVGRPPGRQRARRQRDRAIVPVAIANIHPFRTTEAIGEGWAPPPTARPSWSESCAPPTCELVDGWPVLDLVLLGVGGDGHVLSVFPGSAAFESKAWALAIPAPDAHRAPRRAGDAQPGDPARRARRSSS